MTAVQTAQRAKPTLAGIDTSFYASLLNRGAQGPVSFSPSGHGTTASPSWNEVRYGGNGNKQPGGHTRSPRALSRQQSLEAVAAKTVNPFVPGGKARSTRSAASPPVTPVSPQEKGTLDVKQPRLARANTHPGASPSNNTAKASGQVQKKRRSRNRRGKTSPNAPAGSSPEQTRAANRTTDSNSTRSVRSSNGGCFLLSGLPVSEVDPDDVHSCLWQIGQCEGRLADFSQLRVWPLNTSMHGGVGWLVWCSSDKGAQSIRSKINGRMASLDGVDCPLKAENSTQSQNQLASAAVTAAATFRPITASEE